MRVGVLPPPHDNLKSSEGISVFYSSHSVYSSDKPSTAITTGGSCATTIHFVWFVATFRVTHLWCKLLIGNYFYWKGGTIIIRVHYTIPILRYCIISLPFLSLHRINFILMIRNKHDIPQGYGFPLSQARVGEIL